MANEWDSIPWMIGGGVEHSVEVCRTLAYVALHGEEGIIGSADLQVASSSPNLNLNVAAGAVAILNRETGGSYQTYTARHIAQESIAIAPGGAGTRYDLIVARVENPYFAGSPWTNPDPTGTDPQARQDADYVFLRVISNVPSTTRDVVSLGLGQSAIPLALVTVDAGVTSIAGGKVLDLRRQVSGGQPIGTIVAYAGTTPPPGWLMCDGNTFDATVYPTLAAIVTGTFGTPAGNLRYLPDLRRRVAAGAGGGYGLGGTEGQAVGSRSFTHSHTVPAHGHANTFALEKDMQNNTSTQSSGGNPRVKAVSLTGGVSNAGAMGTDGYIIPHLALNWIIKAI